MRSCKTKVRRRSAPAPPQALLNHKPRISDQTVAQPNSDMTDDVCRGCQRRRRHLRDLDIPGDAYLMTFSTSSLASTSSAWASAWPASTPAFNCREVACTTSSLS